MKKALIFILYFVISACTTFSRPPSIITTGDLGVIIKRAQGGIAIVSWSEKKVLKTISGLGDLSHAALVYSPDQRYAFVFGRDGGLTKVNMVEMKIEKRIIQSGNSIGGAISQDGELIAVSNYEPGGVKIFSAHSLELIFDIPAKMENGFSKTVGLVDVGKRKFVFGLLDANEIWMVDLEDKDPKVLKSATQGRMPYDGFITKDESEYVAGLFQDDGFSVLNLEHGTNKVRRVLENYRKADLKLPVYKMPHLGRWTQIENQVYLPAMGKNAVLVAELPSWKLIKTIELKGQPIFTMKSPNGRYVWINFAMPENHLVQVIDRKNLEVVKTIEVGKGVLHMEFSPKGNEIWLSVRDENRVDIYDTHNFTLKNSISMDQPSGIFFTNRAYENGL